MVATGDVNEILVSEDVVEISATNLSALRAAIDQLQGPSHFKENGNFLQLFFPVGTASLEAINQHCFSQGIVLNHLNLKKKSLEAKFMELTN